jgi:hypothetical protein
MMAEAGFYVIILMLVTILMISDNGKEILGMTSKGLYYSATEGRSWNKRS